LLSSVFHTKCPIKSYTFPQVVEQCLDEERGSNIFTYVKCVVGCGQPKKSAESELRISGGKKSGHSSHPWIVALYLNGSYQCGGSIINKKWVKMEKIFYAFVRMLNAQCVRVPFQIITAAHCSYHNETLITQNDYLQVRVGFKRQNSFSPNEKYVRVRRILIHYQYEKPSKQQTKLCLLPIFLAIISKENSYSHNQG
jgi:hypothetical protein